MSTTHSDALVFFGATGDFACKKSFLHEAMKRGTFNVPVICRGQGRMEPRAAAGPEINR